MAREQGLAFRSVPFAIIFATIGSSVVWAATPGSLDLYRTTQSPEESSSSSSAAYPPSHWLLRWRGGGPAATTAAFPYGGIDEDAIDDEPSRGSRRWNDQYSSRANEHHHYHDQHQSYGHYQGGQYDGVQYQPPTPQQQRHETVWRRPEEEEQTWLPADDGSSSSSPLQAQPPSHDVQRQQHAPFAPPAGRRGPSVDAETVSLALRLTCELNRRLRCGTTDVGRRRPAGRIRPGGVRRERARLPFLHEELLPDGDDEERDGASDGEAAVTAYGRRFLASQAAVGAPSRFRQASPLRIRRMTSEERRNARVAAEEITVFHSLGPSLARGRTTQTTTTTTMTGISRWGPELRPFLEAICDALGCSSSSSGGGSNGGSSSSVVLALAMIYLDRACSIETDRTNPFFPDHRFAACPHLSPRTTHRSVLTAVVLACRALRGEADFADRAVTRRYAEALGQLPELGLIVTEEELGAMERHMLGALGAGGMGVEADKLEMFLEAWGSIFFPEEVHDKRIKGERVQLERRQEPVHHTPSEHMGGQPFPGDWAQQQYQ
mmetsp:Transcript_44805/g.136789  ORF Transcript_44805/g.136789 Transcript_44805/m.136789 type:complete len:549 (-) Transcript_44805:294-1940(-)